MGYYVMNSFTIRTGGVFSGDVDREDMRGRIKKIVLEMRDGDHSPNLGGEDGDPDHCMSKGLTSHKGEVVMIGGVFNYWRYPSASEFAKRLSAEFGTEVMHACFDLEQHEGQMQVWLAGKPVLEVQEHWLGQVLRRTGG